MPLAVLAVLLADLQDRAVDALGEALGDGLAGGAQRGGRGGSGEADGGDGGGGGDGDDADIHGRLLQGLCERRSFAFR
jgi:hypothetical protein